MNGARTMAKPGKGANKTRQAKFEGTRRDNVAHQSVGFSAYKLGKEMKKRHNKNESAAKYSD